MCDEITELENATYLSRRALGMGIAAATLLTACGSRPGGATPAPAPAPSAAPEAEAALTTSKVVVETPDGQADAVFVAPTEGKHPGVLMWPDVAGLRPAYEAMATRLAQAGYAVLVVNPYYRSAKSPILGHFDEWRSEEGRARIAPMRAVLTSDAIARDGAAFVAWLDQRPEVDTSRKIGTQGYCMSGPFALRVAAAAPERVGVCASFHGGGLVTSDADSPHTLFATMQAAALLAIAENDDARAPDDKATLKEAAAQAGRTAEIEVYPAPHGWCALDSPVYDEAQAERAWGRLLAMYAAKL